MSELTGLYALWLREFKVFLREPSRIVSSLVQPLMWLLIYGMGLGSIVSVSATGTSYQKFIFPGILVMTVLFGSLFFGLYIILDKRVDFLKEVLVAPLNRSTIFFGKVLGGSTDGIIQVTLLLIFGGLLFGISFSLYTVVMSYLILILLLIAVTSLGLTIGAVMESPEGFGLISSFLIFPLFFLSGALFPVSNLPGWLRAIVVVNPVSYAVDALRTVILGIGGFGLGLDLSVMAAFALIMVLIGTYFFRKMKI